jgi:hypothetical protein
MGRGRKYAFGPTPQAKELHGIIKRSPWSFMQAAELAGVGSRISSWVKHTHPRLDMFINVADAMGYDVVLVRREREPYNSPDEPTIPGLLND